MTTSVQEDSLEFQDHIKHVCVRQGRDCLGNPRRFVAYASLRDYWSIETISRLLRRNNISENASDIRDTYLCIFSILVYISKVEALPSFTARRLTDLALPWTENRHMVDVPNDTDLQQNFQSTQWIFCPFLLGCRSDTTLEPQSILPFPLAQPRPQQLERTEEADVEQQSHSHLAGKIQIPKRVFLKIFPQEQLEEYKREHRAYATLKNSNENVVKLIASYHWFHETGSRTSTLVLEHAAMGSILDYFKGNDVPYMAKDIEAFWTSFLGVAKGIETIQQQFKGGLHGDIKPSNILLFTGKKLGGSRHFFTLKITDFGNSHVGSISEALDGNTEPHPRSTRTYGAPEVHLIDNVRYAPKPSSDLWSFGCILMEAAVWITGGFHALTDFKSAREKETSAISDFQDIGNCDCFHQGYDVLDSVKCWARIVQENARRHDTITPKMVDLVLKNLLRPEDFRFTPRNLIANMREIISPTMDPMAAQPPYSTTEPLHSPPDPFGFIPPSPRRPLTIIPGVPNQNSTQESSAEVAGSPFSHAPIQNQQGPTDNNVIPRTLTDPFTELVRSETSSPYPKVTLRQLATWRVPKRSLRQELPGWKEAQNLLKGRDFIFIIDNSKSMYDHRAAVIDAADNLAYLVKKLDPDGGEIRWTSNPQAKESFSNSTQAADSARRAFEERSQVDCNIEGALLEAFPSRFRSASMGGGSSSRIRSGLNRIRSNSSSRRLSVLVFTDGVWVPSAGGLCGAERPIEHLIQQMKGQNIQRSDIAVQFLRFGSDQLGIERLDYLDNELAKKPENHGFDIVDHKSDQDSIWGILIGSVFEAMDHLG